MIYLYDSILKKKKKSAMFSVKFKRGKIYLYSKNGLKFIISENMTYREFFPKLQYKVQ